MMNVADYISSLTSAEARSGQGAKVKANKRTVGKSFIFGTGTPKTLSLGLGTVIGVLDQVSTITEKSGTTSVIRRYGKVLLDEPYYDDSNKYVSYLWFRIEDLDFLVSATTQAKPVVDTKELKTIYAITTGGSRLRSTPSALNLSNLVRVVPYGDIVGYTNYESKQYLTVTFYKVFSSTGKELGWVGKNNVSENKPQSKGLPKETASGITDAEDPQAKSESSSSLSITSILLYVVAIIAVIMLGIGGYRKFGKKGEKAK
ncbi:hypothetical protein VB776_06875 [Arcicella sp. DC2W]|uniref:SH3 domain-containing protein n=1 Tax=Arcicella gelida TaxID=2984195 RepID=A0ABU5S2G8_9BACT|nr:hypothetical protein [Arcicella sp. DC2W]MEA5402630.1 hypothetical protein [Arcicella sp. DC2W]